MMVDDTQQHLQQPTTTMMMMMLADYICILITLAELLLYIMIIIIVDDYGRGEDDGDKEIEMNRCCLLLVAICVHSPCRPTTTYKVFLPVSKYCGE